MRKPFRSMLRICSLSVVLFLLVGCGMHDEDRAFVERNVRSRLELWFPPPARIDGSSIRAHGFHRYGAPRTMKVDRCYVDFDVYDGRGGKTHRQFLVVYNGKLITSVVPCD